MTVADPVRAIADAVLYEGYLLWPYSRSALKNQRRWTFGGVYPADHAHEHPDDRCRLRADCLVEGPEGLVVDVRVRFLHVVRRQVLSGDRAVDEAIVDGVRHQSWEEATEREVVAPPGIQTPIVVHAGRTVEELHPGVAVAHSWEALRGSVTTTVVPAGSGVARVTVEVENDTPSSGSARQEALHRTFCSAHVLLRAWGGQFVSLTDPPERHCDAAAACTNVGVWPVLVGDDDATMLASPIILEDHPRIAPESPGDLFDGGEIDQLLTLSILSMTDEERAEMRASDPRAAEILDRTESLTPDDLMRLHGRMLQEGSDLAFAHRRGRAT